MSPLAENDCNLRCRSEIELEKRRKHRKSDRLVLPSLKLLANTRDAVFSMKISRVKFEEGFTTHSRPLSM